MTKRYDQIRRARWGLKASPRFGPSPMREDIKHVVTFELMGMTPKVAEYLRSLPTSKGIGSTPKSCYFHSEDHAPL